MTIYTLLFSHSIVSNSLWPHELQYARLPCPLLSPRVRSNSCPLNRWCCPTSHPLLPPSPALNLSQHQGLSQWVGLFTSGDQSTGASALASVIPMNFLPMNFPGGSDSSICLSICRRPGFDPWVGKICWRRKWKSTPVLFPGKSHGQRSLVGYSLWSHKESDTTERLHFLSFQ